MATKYDIDEDEYDYDSDNNYYNDQQSYDLGPVIDVWYDKVQMEDTLFDILQQYRQLDERFHNVTVSDLYHRTNSTAIKDILCLQCAQDLSKVIDDFCIKHQKVIEQGAQIDSELRHVYQTYFRDPTMSLNGLYFKIVNAVI